MTCQFYDMVTAYLSDRIHYFKFLISLIGFVVETLSAQLHIHIIHMRIRSILIDPNKLKQ